MLQSIARALEQRDQTLGHGARVAALAEPVALALGWDRERIRALRLVTTKPVCIGFGISTPAQVAAIGRLADGAIVASAIVRLVEEHAGSPTLVEDVGAFIAELKAPLRAGLGDPPQTPPPGAGFREPAQTPPPGAGSGDAPQTSPPGAGLRGSFQTSPAIRTRS